MYELALFAGAGGGILGSLLIGHTVVCAVEIEKYPRSVLQKRQAEGFLPFFPIWDDIRTFSIKNPKTKSMFNYLRSIREDLVITAGFPCQDISVAGKGAGIDGKRSGLIWDTLRVVREIQPAAFFLENSPNFINRGFDRVLGEISQIGYNAKWVCLGASDVGAPHRRKRFWLLAYANDKRLSQNWSSRGYEEKKSLSSCYGENGWWTIDPAELSDTTVQGLPQRPTAEGGSSGETKQSKRCCFKNEVGDALFRGFSGDDWGKPGEKFTERHKRVEREERDLRPTQSRLGRVAHRVAHRVDRIKVIGNGQVPAVVVAAWTYLIGGLNDHRYE